MAGPSTPTGARARGDRPELLTAAIFIAFGVLGLFLTRDLRAGSLAHMSAGFMPRVVCVLLLLVGAIIGIRGLRKPGLAIEGIRLRPLIVVTISVVGFAYAVTHLGFVVASLWLVVTGCFAEPRTRSLEIALLAIGLTTFSALVFVYGLRVQVPLWPTW